MTDRPTERGSAVTEYSIALAFAGVLIAIAMPRILRPDPTDAALWQRAWPWLLIAGAVAILAMAAQTWWREHRRR